MSTLNRFFLHKHQKSGPSARILAILMLISLLTASIAPAAVSAQGNDPATELLRRLSPEEKVGQLFLVNFTGSEFTDVSPIYDLIANYHVGGVVLTAENDNFVSEKTPLAAFNLTNALQEAEWNSSVN